MILPHCQRKFQTTAERAVPPPRLLERAKPQFLEVRAVFVSIPTPYRPTMYRQPLQGEINGSIRQRVGSPEDFGLGPLRGHRRLVLVEKDRDVEWTLEDH